MIIADTGFWLALANNKDRYHRAAVNAFERLQAPLVTTWPVVTETCHLLVTRMSSKAQLRFMDAMADGAAQIFEFEASDLSEMRTLMAKYESLPMDLADASLVLLATRLGHGEILSTDKRDFRVYRWKNHHPFKNLMEPL